MTREFALSFAALTVVQGATAWLPRPDAFAALSRLRSPLWSIIPVGSLVGVIAAISVAGETSDALTWLALVACPILAAVALGFAMHGRRAWLALLVAPAFAVAWAAKGTLAGDLAALAITALSCVTLGALLAAVAPHGWLTAGVVIMALADAYLVFHDLLQPANNLLVAAAPAAGLPRLQFAQLDVANMGYGDLFVAGVAGAVLAAQGRQRFGAALVTALGLAWGLLFFAIDTIPATVPVAAALVLTRALPGGARRRSDPNAIRDKSHELS